MREKLIELLKESGVAFPISTANFLIANGVTVPDTNVGKWIPVGERLPEERVLVLVFTDKGTQRVSRLFGDEWYTTAWVLEGVTHWMPLPEPPEVCK